MLTCPASVELLEKIELFPTLQSCAIWQYAIIKQFDPTLVVNLSFVPLLIVTHSLIVVLSPISTNDSSHQI